MLCEDGDGEQQCGDLTDNSHHLLSGPLDLRPTGGGVQQQQPPPPSREAEIRADMVSGITQQFSYTIRVELIGHFKPCITDIYLHIDARMSDYIHTHP